LNGIEHHLEAGAVNRLNHISATRAVAAFDAGFGINLRAAVASFSNPRFSCCFHDGNAVPAAQPHRSATSPVYMLAGPTGWRSHYFADRAVMRTARLTATA
jgi:hypothetical protein